jgi:Peroxidase
MDQEEGGVEISLSAATQAKLQRRFEKENPKLILFPGEGEDDDDDTLPPPPPPPLPFSLKGFHESKTHDGSYSSSTKNSTLPPEVVTKLERDTNDRTRFRRIIFLVLVLCITGVVTAAVLLAKSGGNGKDKGVAAQASQASSNTNTNVLEDSPSLAPSALAESAAATTNAPTDALITSVRAVKSKYDFSEAITLFFAYGEDFSPAMTDWIGIYPVSSVTEMGVSNLGDATTFLFPCNQPTMCETAISEGQVVFSKDTVVQQETRLSSLRWPLEPDLYQAFLLRGLEQPFQVLASSNEFTVNPDFMVHTVVPALEAIEAELRSAIDNDPHMGPKFVRLGFHDCAGGCDGCVDLEFADNAGLEIPLAVLAPIVEKHESKSLGISRADIWALSAFVAADIAQERSDTKVDFSMEFIGRKNCEDLNDQCFDANGVERNCSSVLGPHVELPMADITTDNLFHFFNEVFGFTVQETVALMGAHTLGSLTREHSGFPGPNGWVRDNLLLDHDYYRELVGGSSRDADLETMIETAPDWFRFDIDNSDLEGMPDRRAWHAFPPALDGSGDTVQIVMLTADVSIIHLAPSFGSLSLRSISNSFPFLVSRFPWSVTLPMTTCLIPVELVVPLPNISWSKVLKRSVVLMPVGPLTSLRTIDSITIFGFETLMPFTRKC